MSKMEVRDKKQGIRNDEQSEILTKDDPYYIEML